MHPDPTWIVVVDHQSARFFLRSHWGEPLTEFSELSESADFMERAEEQRVAVSTQDALNNRKRGQASDEIEISFLHRVAREIDRVMIDHAAQGLVLCAPPKELCLLRSYISDRSRAKLSCEITRDLVGEKASSIDAVVSHLKA